MELNAFTLEHTGKKNICHKPISVGKPGPNQVFARATHSSISAGTEALIFNGEVEQGMSLDATIDQLKACTIQYPFSYGYAWVGIIEAIGQAVTEFAVGDKIFAFAPHQTHHLLNATDCYRVPSHLPSNVATLLPFMETALSIAHDASPVAGEDICILGQGTIGLLTTWLLSQFPLASLNTVDPLTTRHELSQKLGANNTLTIEESQEMATADTVIEVSGNPEALNHAVQMTRPNGKVVVASWYGNRPSNFSLGTHFHRGRIQLISSQVSQLRPQLQGTWTKARRLGYALKLLSDLPYNLFEAKRIAFSDCERLYPEVLESPSQPSHTYFTYGD